MGIRNRRRRSSNFTVYFLYFILDVKMILYLSALLDQYIDLTPTRTLALVLKKQPCPRYLFFPLLLKIIKRSLSARYNQDDTLVKAAGNTYTK